MCGIVGILNYSNHDSSLEIMEMCNKIKSRGPDAEGFYLNNFLALGHRRLSVIDLESGDQPMYSQDRNIVIVYNGEIYNFKKLREELLQKGHFFKTKSDTEVLIEAYIEYGIEVMLPKLEGMFSFALYDIKNEMLYIARDKFGEKPLYYTEKSNKFLFASELKAFGKNLNDYLIDPMGLNYFLSLTYIPAPHTIYQNVFKLEPGSYISISKDGSKEIKKYYDLISRIKFRKKENNYEKAKDNLNYLLSESVKNRMISDVPIGAFLSGGIDSSIITALMNKFSEIPINTFSIGFNEIEYDESKRAKLVSNYLKTNHTVHFLNYDDLIEILDEILQYYDEPFGDSSALPSFYLAKKAREKVKVALTGDCADELFGGYEKYLGQIYIEKFKKLPVTGQNIFKKIVSLIPHSKYTNSILRRIKKVINNSEKTGFELHYNLMSLGFNDEERKHLLGEKYFADIKKPIEKIYNSFPSNSQLEKSFYTDLKLVLEGDMLVKLDRVCMKNSLEARVPFLDSNIVEAAYCMPLEFKIKSRNKKRILKDTFQYLLPNKVFKFRKKGFGVPIDIWFKNELKPELLKYLNKDLIEKQGIFNFDLINKLINDHMENKENNKSKLWNLFVFQKWYLNRVNEI